MFDQLIALLKNAQTVTVLTGAGVSAESGIPTFREAQTGMWAQFDPEELASATAFERDPVRVWQWYAWRRDLIAKCQPNPAHTALAALEKRYETFTLITQNVDGLHQVAGSQNVIELHGNIERCKCFVCARPSLKWDKTATEPPACVHCGGLLRPDIVWFGEQLQTDHLDRAWQAAQAADVFMSIGTSSLVYPAAHLPEVALQNDIPLVEINPNPTQLTRFAHFAVEEAAGVALPKLLAHLSD